MIVDRVGEVWLEELTTRSETYLVVRSRVNVQGNVIHDVLVFEEPSLSDAYIHEHQFAGNYRGLRRIA